MIHPDLLCNIWILENPKKLNQYIQDVQRTSFLFSAEATFDQPIELKLWYKVYLERYGPPGDGVFDTELLGQIIQDLIYPYLSRIIYPF